MSDTQTYQFEELDDRSRQYLLQVRGRQGRGMPGVYVSRNDWLPGLGALCGVIVLIVGAIACVNLIEQEPLAVAMLETAVLLVGVWLIAYAVRVGMAAKNAKYVGKFVYADAETLWECSGWSVTASSLEGMTKARGVQHFSKERKYQHTSISVYLSGTTRCFNIDDQRRARELVLFLNTVAWMRSGGSDDGPEAPDGLAGSNWRDMPALIMGGLAREYAKKDRMPDEISAKSLGLEVTELPLPTREGFASWGAMAYAVIVIVSVGSIFLFKQLNVPWRDQALWDDINSIHDQDERAPVLRYYLRDPRNVEHRDGAQEMLRTIYQSNIARIRQANAAIPNQGFVVLPGQPLDRIKVDDDLLDGLAMVLTKLAEQEEPVVSVRVKEKGNNNDQSANDREKMMLDRYTSALRDGVGENLVTFVEAPPDTPAMIEVDYALEKAPAATGASWRCTIQFSFRKTPEDEPKTFKKTLPLNQTPDLNAMAALANELGAMTAGPIHRKIQLESLD